ncbi:N-acetylgalactosamine-N,N'-diacetylbacillosaminyl-diphospho-undecaprenol 4-alpha-N-acetylgalactosaminyltransferase [subsurface metagenome]
MLLSEHANLKWSLKGQKFKGIKRILIRNLYPKATRIISVSKGAKENLITDYKVPENKCFVIYNMVDVERIRKLANERMAHPCPKENVLIVIACGRLTAQKNYPLLLKAMSLVLRENSARLLILGEGEDQSKLEEYARTLGISHNIAFLGFQSNPFKYMSRATVFVLSSSWEGFGNVIIEAMACGIPVVSTRCPSGPDEIITDEVNGLLVPVGDANALANAIVRLFKDESLRRRLSEAGKKRAEDFRGGKMVAEYERVFEEMVRL